MELPLPPPACLNNCTLAGNFAYSGPMFYGTLPVRYTAYIANPQARAKTRRRRTQPAGAHENPAQTNPTRRRARKPGADKPNPPQARTKTPDNPNPQARTTSPSPVMPQHRSKSPSNHRL